MQGLTQQAAAQLTGVEYLVIPTGQEPSLLRIHETYRHSPVRVDLSAAYYVSSGTIYRAPDILRVLSARLVRLSTCTCARLTSSCSLAIRLLECNPYRYLLLQASASFHVEKAAKVLADDADWSPSGGHCWKHAAAGGDGSEADGPLAAGESTGSNGDKNSSRRYLPGTKRRRSIDSSEAAGGASASADSDASTSMVLRELGLPMRASAVACEGYERRVTSALEPATKDIEGGDEDAGGHAGGDDGDDGSRHGPLSALVREKSGQLLEAALGRLR